MAAGDVLVDDGAGGVGDGVRVVHWEPKGELLQVERPVGNDVLVGVDGDVQGGKRGREKGEGEGVVGGCEFQFGEGWRKVVQRLVIVCK